MSILGKTRMCMIDLFLHRYCLYENFDTVYFQFFSFLLRLVKTEELLKMHETDGCVFTVQGATLSHYYSVCIYI